MKNKEVLISNLEVIKNELTKAEKEIGKDYAKVLQSSSKEEITKEEFYYENMISIALDVSEKLEVLTGILKYHNPDSLVELAEEDGHDFKDLSFELKKDIVKKKVQDSPMFTLISAFEQALKELEKHKRD